MVLHGIPPMQYHLLLFKSSGEMTKSGSKPSNHWGSAVSRLLEIVGFLEDHVLDLYGPPCLASPNKSQEVPSVNAFRSPSPIQSHLLPADTSREMVK